MENLYHPTAIRTFTGKYIDPFNASSDDIDILDIAHALSFHPRFAGHLNTFYSVAEHSLDVCKRLAKPHRLAGLLHDASEAYLLDIPKPIKSRLIGYELAESRMMGIISKKFGFEYPLLPEIKQADHEALEWEWYNMMLEDYISERNKFDVIQEFMDMFHQLTDYVKK